MGHDQREGHRQIPVMLRLRMDERAQLADLQNLYVFSSQSTAKVPLGQVSSMSYQMEAQKLRRRGLSGPRRLIVRSHARHPSAIDGVQEDIAAGGEEESQVD